MLVLTKEDTRVNVDTGELENWDYFRKKGVKEDKLVEVKEEEMTERQKKIKQVSPHDTRSPLGERWNKLRNTPCSCGSGRKYKKCCMFKDRATC